MDNSNVLDSLVRIASMGTAGVCVLVIFIAGFLIWKLSDTASKEKIGLIKFYMKICLVIAGISFISGIANFFTNQNNVNAAEKVKNEVVAENTEMKKAVSEELPKIEKAQKDIKEAKNIIAENPTPSTDARNEAKTKLDTATRTVSRIDVSKLKRYVLMPPIKK